MNEIEIWKPVVGYENNYAVSNLGRVKRTASGCGARVGHVLKANPRGDKGYLSVGLRKDGNYKSFLVARIVALTFIHNPEDKPQVNHKDGNKTNNRVDNLEWATNGENAQHAYDLGLNPREKIFEQIPKPGELNAAHKLKDNQVVEIRNKYASGNYSLKNISKEYGVYYTTIHKIVKHLTWKHL